MGKKNNCRAVPNNTFNQPRVSCSVCGTIWDDSVKGKGVCPKCRRRIKPSSMFGKKFCIGNN